MDVGRAALDIHQVVFDTEASSSEPGHRVYDEKREVPVPHVLLWTADRAAGDLRGHCARLVEPALCAEHARLRHVVSRHPLCSSTSGTKPTMPMTT